MRYECDRCGACCREIIVEIEDLDVAREPRLALVAPPSALPPGMVLLDDEGQPTEPLVPGYAGGAILACGRTHPCPLLGADNLCTIYPTRPNCCVAFPAGSDLCQQARAMAGIPRLEAASA